MKMNGKTGPDFRLARSVKQGCPLAPYLFILATDLLGHMLADPRNEVEGLSLPRGGLIKDQTFADDTALFLKGTPSNLDKAQKVLSTFSVTVAPPSSLWTHLRVQICGNAKAVGTWGTIPTSSTRGGERGVLEVPGKTRKN
jgi:hypothetical protein